MGRVSQTLTAEEIIEINRQMTTTFGGSFNNGNENVINPNSLYFLIEEINGTLFGEELYPDVFQKAAIIAWRIIEGHIFYDGNKRTGMEACRLFLELNSISLTIDNEIIEVAINIANGTGSVEYLTKWIANKSTY